MNPPMKSGFDKGSINPCHKSVLIYKSLKNIQYRRKICKTREATLYKYRPTMFIKN